MVNIYKLDGEVNYGCCYEIYDREKKVMAPCGNPAEYRYGANGKRGLCREHMLAAKAASGCCVVPELGK